jgi:uncharacterized zinc-type alcohol dehydrogenase-like protein
VTTYKVGDLVGEAIDSRQMFFLQAILCENGATFTYNSPDKHLEAQTYGGYSTQ